MKETKNAPERARFRETVKKARTLITQTLPIEEADEFSLMLEYNGFYLKMIFSETHLFMLLYLMRPLNRPGSKNDVRLINMLNLNDVLGSHAVNTESGYYLYRTLHWLGVGLTKTRFLEMLDYSVGEASQAYMQLARLEGKNESD